MYTHLPLWMLYINFCILVHVLQGWSKIATTHHQNYCTTTGQHQFPKKRSKWNCWLSRKCYKPSTPICRKQKHITVVHLRSCLYWWRSNYQRRQNRWQASYNDFIDNLFRFWWITGWVATFMTHIAGVLAFF